MVVAANKAAIEAWANGSLETNLKTIETQVNALVGVMNSTKWESNRSAELQTKLNTYMDEIVTWENGFDLAVRQTLDVNAGNLLRSQQSGDVATGAGTTKAADAIVVTASDGAMVADLDAMSAVSGETIPAVLTAINGALNDIPTSFNAEIFNGEGGWQAPNRDQAGADLQRLTSEGSTNVATSMNALVAAINENVSELQQASS